MSKGIFALTHVSHSITRNQKTSHGGLERKQMKQKILLFDIEVAPLVSENWGYYEQNALRVTRASYLISFAYKWLGGEIHAYSHLNCSGKTVRDDRPRVKKLWRLFNQADVLVAHNGRDFDVKLAMAFFIHNGLPPPRPFKIVDTKIVAKRHFRFYSNKLDELGNYLNLGRKLHTGGIDLWFQCDAGDRSALKRMVIYNKQDVELLEKIYLRLRPFMDVHPNYNVMLGRVIACPNCGGKVMERKGYHMTRLTRAQRYHCLDCGAWSHGKPEKLGIELR